MASPQFALEQSDTEAVGRRREYSEFLLQIANLLSPQHRCLVKLVFEHGVKISTLATATGVSATSLYGIMSRLEKRVQKPEVQLIWKIQENIPPDARRVVVGHIIQGRSVQALSGDFGFPTKWIYDTINSYREYAHKQLRQGSNGRSAKGLAANS